MSGPLGGLATESAAIQSSVSGDRKNTRTLFVPKNAAIRLAISRHNSTGEPTVIVEPVSDPINASAFRSLLSKRRLRAKPQLGVYGKGDQRRTGYQSECHQ